MSAYSIGRKHTAHLEAMCRKYEEWCASKDRTIAALQEQRELLLEQVSAAKARIAELEAQR